MYKWVLKLVIVAAAITYFLTNASLAQSFFGAEANPQAKPTAVSGSRVSQEDFANAVNAINQQEKNQLSQQFSQIPPLPSAPGANTPAATVPPAPLAPSQPAQPTPPVEMSNPPSPPPQTYTGFSTGGSPAPAPKTPANNPPKTGGWNIHY